MTEITLCLEPAVVLFYTRIARAVQAGGGTESGIAEAGRIIESHRNPALYQFVKIL